jgi:hypothetical protein
MMRAKFMWLRTTGFALCFGRSTWLRTTGVALCFAGTACSATQQQNMQSFLTNASADAKIVACLDATGAALAGPVLTATGNSAGIVVGAAGSATAQVACPPGTAPSVQPVIAPVVPAPPPVAPASNPAADLPPNCPGSYQASNPNDPNYNPACVQYLLGLAPAPRP